MQPYFFPYIGYWQLINAVDKFVLLDDVNYIKRGYINRNEILLNGVRYRFTVPISHISQNKLIMHTTLNFDKKNRIRLLNTIEQAYRKRPFFRDIINLISDIIYYEENDLTKYIYNSIIKINACLGIGTEIMISSQIEKKNIYKAQDRIIEICRVLGADEYINPCGGRDLYEHSRFDVNGVKLFFLSTEQEKIKYNQGYDSFHANLSIIDLLMNNSKNELKKILLEYKLIV